MTVARGHHRQPARGRLVADNLVQLGHRGLRCRWPAARRRRRTRDVVASTTGHPRWTRAAGLDLDEELIIYAGTATPSTASRRSASCSNAPPSVGDFCHTDEMASSPAACAARDRCPTTSPWPASTTIDVGLWGLTTVTQHAHEQGARAALALLAALNEDLDGPGDGTDLARLTVQLVPRESTRAVRATPTASDPKGV